MHNVNMTDSLSCHGAQRTRCEQAGYRQCQSSARCRPGQVGRESQALDLQVAGPRKEDIAQAEAQLRSDQAQLALLRRQLADMELKAPIDGSRALSAGLSR